MVTGGRPIFKPSCTPGSTKYGEKNIRIQPSSSLPITPRQQQQLTALTSLSLTKKTWASYKTAETMLAKCCRANNIKKDLPISASTVMTFILWLAYDRGLKAATINSYLAGVRQLHIMKGVDPPKLRTNLVSMALKGQEHKDQVAKRLAPHKERQPITPDVLLLLKARLSESTFLPVDQRLVWSVCTIAFFGAFRGIELLCRQESCFDPAFNLLAEDIAVVEDSESGGHALQIKVKAPKEDKRGKSVIVDVFQARRDICPVTAYIKWQKLLPPSEPGLPAFRWSSGAPLTSRRLNSILKDRLAGYLDGAEAQYTSHSFRTGAASMMGSLGYTDDDIKVVGKWASSAFEKYVKLPRNKRKAVARSFCNQFS